jgi:malate synthase
MAAVIPIKNDPEANAAAIAKVQADKEREVRNGHDGTWVAHPGLVQVAMDVFNANMPGANQLGVLRSEDNGSVLLNCWQCLREASPKRAFGRTSTWASSTSKAG